MRTSISASVQGSRSREYQFITYATNIIYSLKTGYIEFARLESSVDDVHSAIVSPVVSMAAS